MASVVHISAVMRDAIIVLEKARKLIVAVIDDDGRLRGVVSDGDIRRALLRGVALEASVTAAMTIAPFCLSARIGLDQQLQELRRHGLAACPLVDEAGLFVDIITVHDFSRPAPAGQVGSLISSAVIMAGGEGRRLRPLTERVPKPMLPVGGVPLLERQVRSLVNAGFVKIRISVNYLANVIVDHFGDGSNFNARIEYLREPEKLGTAGALALLRPRPMGPFLVMNGDVFTTIDFTALGNFHLESASDLTVAAIQHDVQVPFGVIEHDGDRVLRVVEKPSQRFLCNAGVYVLEPPVLDLVPVGRFDMTDLIDRCMEQGGKVAVFPIHEFWSDIGSHSDLERINKGLQANAIAR